jgi:hypothetical protein
MAEFIRLNVNMNVETAEALKKLASDRGTSYTETVRRAISILYYLDNEMSRGTKLQIQEYNGDVRELILL